MPDLNDLQRASTEQLLEHHVGEPLKRITVEMLEVAAERIRDVLADCDELDRRARNRKDRTHHEDCWLEHTRCLAARIRRTLTGEDPTP